MSKSSDHQVKCKCGQKQNFTIWDSVNVTIDPGLKDKLIKGELQTMTCNKCGESSEIIYPLLYHDMDKKLLIWLRPSGNLTESEYDNQFPFIEPMLKSRLCRIVTSRNDLLEKIYIFEEGLDDRVIELFKIFIKLNNEEIKQAKILFTGSFNHDNGSKLIGFLMQTANGQKSFYMEWETYNNFSLKAKGGLPVLESDFGKWVKVDEEWTLQST